MLGQSGLKLSFPGANIYIDPYLSDSVQILHAPDLVRQIPIPIQAVDVNDADWVFITHIHTDHCDPHTVPTIGRASPQAKFLCPAEVAHKLIEWGIHKDRITIALEDWVDIGANIKVRAIPSAHPEIERDYQGRLLCVGYLIEILNQCIYIAGDTSVKQEIIDTLVSMGPILVAFIPVNERNFFRERRGIIGNMSVREAFQFATEIGAKRVVPVHWDMFAANSVYLEEICLIYQRSNPEFELLINPKCINFSDVLISIIIRTLNEAQYLESLLSQIQKQILGGLSYEIILVDSGSVDATLEIAERYGCRILHIERENFSFGRSLNIGCAAAAGDILVIVSGHCVPTDDYWLQNLCQPLMNGSAGYVYGRQLAGDLSSYSESRIFSKFYPVKSSVPQDGFFCNNANAAILRTVWDAHRFDEDLTGLEDMELAKRFALTGGLIGYVADAKVFHYHQESWQQIRKRFERESIALQNIMPQVQISIFDTFRYMLSSIWMDWISSLNEKDLKIRFFELFRYRYNQYIGSWMGNHHHRKLSKIEKDRYFYPE